MTPDDAAPAAARRTIRFDDLSGERPAEVVHGDLEDAPTQELALPGALGDDEAPDAAVQEADEAPANEADEADEADEAPAAEAAPARRTVSFDDLSPREDPSSDYDAFEGLLADGDEDPTPVRERGSGGGLPPRPRRAAAGATSTRATRDGERTPHRVPPGRAVAGAALSVCGVALGVVVLLWITDDPSADTAADGLSTAQSSQQEALDAVPATASPAPPSPAAAPSPQAVEPPATTATTATTAPVVPVVPVTVLNNSRRSGLAARAAAQFEDGGWPVARTGNFRGRIPVTTVYYDRGLEASARAFADAFDGVARVRPRFDGLPARGLVVVVTREFTT